MTVEQLMTLLTHYKPQAQVFFENRQWFSDIIAVEEFSHYTSLPVGEYIVITDNWREE